MASHTSHHDTKDADHAKADADHKADAKAAPKATGTTVTPRDAAAATAATDAQKMLTFLTLDWLNNDRTHASQIAALLAGLLAAAGPPVNVDVPFVSLTGETANCTMGNWTGEPTSYTYAWHRDGVAIAGATAATYTIVPADDSTHSIACVVTATNALGSTVAPMSNAVAVP